MTKDNTARFLIMGLLSHEPMSGYDIKKRLEVAMSHMWDLSYGQIYPTLRALESEGLVTMEMIVSESGPNRKVYTITQAGKAALRDWVAVPPRPETHRYEILLKVFFGQSVGPTVITSHVQDFRERNVQAIEVMEAFERELEPLVSRDPAHSYMLLTVMMGKDVYQAHVRWADRAMEVLGTMEDGGEVDG